MSEEEKAIEYFEKDIEKRKQGRNYFVDYEEVMLHEQTILNLIKSQQEEIRILKSKRVNMFEQLDCIEKKNKIIDLMAKHLEKYSTNFPELYGANTNKWKQYFEKKAEESNVK